MNLSEMRSRVLTIAREEADTYWSASDVDEALNDGLVELADLSEFYETVFSIPLLGDRIYYDLRSHLPAGEQFLSPRRIHNLTTNEWLEWRSTRWLDTRFYRRWQQVRSAPNYAFFHGLHFLGIHGSAGGDTGHLRTSAVAIPNPLVYDSDTPRFPVQFHLAAVEYGVHDLYIQDNEIDLALQHWQEFTTLAQGLVQDVENRITLDRAWKFGMARR